MAYHSAEFSISGVNTANTSLLNLKATSTRSLSVMEFGVSYTVLSATAYDLGLVRMNAVGTGAITSTAGAPHVAYTGEASVGVLETVWATARPTRTGTRFRRLTLPLTIGAGVIWQFGPDGIDIPTSGGLVLEGISASGATTGTLEGYFTWRE
jgi:hypothetical protein